MGKVYINNNAGFCAVCNSENLQYDSNDINNGQIGYYYTCLDCDNSGVEWYEMEYIETVSFGKE